MATLTETAYYARRTINWAILAVICYIILRITWGFLISAWFSFFPSKPPPPNFRFGKLPALKFPESSPSAHLTFRLETIEGTVPAASDSAAVFFMPKPAPNLLAMTKSQGFAKRLGFNPKAIEESKSIYRFDDDSTILRRLRYDIVSNNFILRYGFEQDTGLFSERGIPGVDAAVSEARSLLQTFSLYIPDIAKGSTKATYLKLVGDTLVPTTSLSQADAVRVDFFLQSIAGRKVFTPHPNEGHVAFIFSGSKNSKKKVLQFAYTHWPIDYDTFGTYALKTSAEAWQELKGGGGYIARYPTSAAATVVIRQVYLGYYNSFDPQMYLQPIFVFEGDDGFLAYVPAIVPEWIEK